MAFPHFWNRPQELPPTPLPVVCYRGYWGSVDIVCSSEQVQCGGVATVNTRCGVSAQGAVQICVMFPNTILIAHVDIVVRIIFPVLRKENGTVVSKYVVVDVYNLYPGVCDTEAGFGHGVVQVKGGYGRLPCSVEQITSTFVVCCCGICVVCLSEW